jgi:hypothetical protein
MVVVSNWARLISLNRVWAPVGLLIPILLEWEVFDCDWGFFLGESLLWVEIVTWFILK